MTAAAGLVSDSFDPSSPLPRPSELRPLAHDSAAWLRVHQHFYILLSSKQPKRFTIIPDPSSRSLQQQPQSPPQQHKRPRDDMERVDSALPLPAPQRAELASGEEDEFGWSLDNYPADKRARVRLPHGAPPPRPAAAAGDSQPAMRDDTQWTLSSLPSSQPPAVAASIKNYKQTTLPFAAASAASSDPSSGLSFDASLPGYYSLAFPCLCLHEGRLEPEAAVSVAMDAVQAFLASHPAPMLRLLMVEEEADVHRQLQRCIAAQYPAMLAPQSRFSLLLASLTSLPAASVSQSVVNSTDWRWSTGGDRRRRALNLACNSQLLQWTAASMLSPTAAGRIGQAYVVRLPSKCPLSDSGVRVVVQTVPPCFSPARSDYVGDAADGDDKGLAVLRQTYSAMLAAWYASLRLPKHYKAAAAAPQAEESELDSSPPAASAHDDAQSGSSSSVAASESELPESFVSIFPFPSYSPPRLGAGDGSSFSLSRHSALSGYLRFPRSPALQSCVFCEDRDFVVVYDKYPKAGVHLLLMPKRPQLQSVADLDASSLQLVRDLQRRAEHLLLNLPSSAPSFLVGFHALPSLYPLHLHVLSSELDSPHLKHKKHYNSFTTAFFLTLDDVVRRLETDGRIRVDEQRTKEELRRPLRCCRCHAPVATMPALKRHLAACRR